MEKNFNIDIEDGDNKEQLLRYISFWPYLLILISLFLIIGFTYIRYSTFQYKSSAVIEILDEAQDSEMALPTELTIFNRSMINLENEVSILKSYNLHSTVVKELKSNILFFDIGNIKITQKTKNYWFDDYELNFNIDTNLVENSLEFDIYTDNGQLRIAELNEDGDVVRTLIFESFDTRSQNHDLPFDLNILNLGDSSLDSRKLVIHPISLTTNTFRGRFSSELIGEDSDQLNISIIHPNPEIGREYLNSLLLAFDFDGVSDRQLEYKRTIEFVNNRESILKNELEAIELRKQNFKQINNLSDLSIDANNNIDLKYTYDSELFNSESQKTIANYLLESMTEKKYEYLPINVGLDDFDVNIIVNEYNNLVSQRNKYISEAGPNNALIKSLNTQLDGIINNISNSLENYLNSLEIKIQNLRVKELEFENIYNNVPENEKELRSIERELTIKEALYLLLLQKREEAAINLAVVKPTIKIIDFPITNPIPVSPNTRTIYMALLLFGVFIYIITLYFWFLFDNKIHHKDQLSKKLSNKIPVICEIPYIKDEDELNSISNSSSRSPLSESIRMLTSNLKFINIKSDDNDIGKSILFSSSVKGEGKTLVSLNTANSLADEYDKKVILIGSDLRNPQIHKLLGVTKNQKGVSDILYKKDINNYQKYIQKFNNLDVLFSGTIPPNPTALLASQEFKSLFLKLKEVYDYVIVDSAPCLIVSDTFQIIDYFDSVIFIYRANYTDVKLVDYINEIHEKDKAKNLSVVLNSVGNSSSYGYKYGYQYGYRYGYKYGYNYGYGYGYTSDD